MIIAGENPIDIYLPKYLKLFSYNEPDKKKDKKRRYGSLKDLYMHYVQDQENKGLKPKFTYSQFREFLIIHNGLISVYIIQTGNFIKLPYGLGEIGISKFMPRYYIP